MDDQSQMQYRMIAPLNQMVLRLQMICNFDEGIKKTEDVPNKKESHATEVKV